MNRRRLEYPDRFRMTIFRQRKIVALQTAHRLAFSIRNADRNINQVHLNPH
jgi:hypothetical protein